MKHGGYADNQEPSSDNSSVSEEIVLADYVQRPLRLRGRPKMTPCQKLWTGLFYTQLAFQLILGMVLCSSRNVQGLGSDGTCPDGYVKLNHNDICVTMPLYAQATSCLSNPNNPNANPNTWNGVSSERRLQTKKSNKLWDMLRRHNRLPATTIAVSAAMCVATLFVMTFAAACVTWGLFVFNGLLLLYGFYLTQNWMLLIALVVLAALTLWRRRDIEMAIASMQVGAEALKDTPVVFGLCAGLQLVWFVYAVIFMWFTVFGVSGAMDIGPTCDPSQPSFWTRLYLKSAPFLFVVTTYFFRHCMLAVCSMAVGAWCFKEEAAAQGMSSSASAILGLKLAFTTSCGSVFAASLILGVVDAIRRKVTNNGMLWWCDPLACLCKMLWCALESTIQSLTRFALIAHMFQGDGLCFVANLTSDMLTKRLPSIVICGIVSDKVTRQLATMGATAVGIFVWFYLDAKEGLGFFSTLWAATNQANGEGSSFGKLSMDMDGQEASSETMKHVILIGLTLVMLWCVRNAVLTIILAFFVSSFDVESGWWSCFLIAVVLASLVAVIFNYFASVLEYATDVAFYCTALEAEGGQRRTLRLEKLHDIAEDHVRAELDNDV